MLAFAGKLVLRDDLRYNLSEKDEVLNDVVDVPHTELQNVCHCTDASGLRHEITNLLPDTSLVAHVHTAVVETEVDEGIAPISLFRFPSREKLSEVNV